MNKTSNLKQEFNLWLLELNNPMINKLGIKSMVEKLDNKLSISNCSDIEYDFLIKMIDLFYRYKNTNDKRIVKDLATKFVNDFF